MNNTQSSHDDEQESSKFSESKPIDQLKIMKLHNCDDDDDDDDDDYSDNNDKINGQHVIGCNNNIIKSVSNDINCTNELIGWNENHLKMETTTDDDEIEIQSSKIGIFRQVLVTCSVLLTAASCGMPIGFSSVILPQLYNSTDPLKIDLEMGSWIASVHSLATPVGSFISGPITDRFGRRPALLLSMIPLLTGWIVLALSQSHLVLLLGRIIAGISVGIIAPPAQILLAEIAEPQLRGLLIGAPFVSYSLGILLVYVLGSKLHWRSVAWAGTILPIFSFITLLMVPESPVYLAQNGQIERASKVLNWLRGGDIYAKKELAQLLKRLNNEKLINKSLSFFEIISKTSVIKPLIIINCFHLLLIFSGTYIVVFYAVDIISEFGGENYDTMSAANLTALVRLIFTIIFCFLLLFIKRRPMVIYSGLLSSISSIFLAIFTYIRLNEQKTLIDIYVSGICILIYIGSNTGFMVMPGVMVGELLPAKIRGQIAGYIFSLFNIALFGVTKIFPFTIYYLKSYGLFFIFGLSSLIASILLYIMLPETKNKQLCEIEEYFEQNNWIWINRKKYNKNNNKV